MKAAAAFLCGLVFAAGLGLGGMTRPGRVIAFLDVFGEWDPALAFVMAGALITHAVLRVLIVRLPAPLLAPAFAATPTARIDGRLLTGAALFGVGWGMAGFCPGPALVAAGAGMSAAWIVLAGMLAGMLVFDRFVEAGTPTLHASEPSDEVPR